MQVPADASLLRSAFMPFDMDMLNWFIFKCLEENHTDRALQYYKLIEGAKRGLAPDSRTQGLLLVHYTRAGRVDDALRVWNSMRPTILGNPPAWSWPILAGCMAAVGRHAEMVEIAMAQLSRRIRPLNKPPPPPLEARMIRTTLWCCVSDAQLLPSAMRALRAGLKLTPPERPELAVAERLIRYACEQGTLLAAKELIESLPQSWKSDFSPEVCALIKKHNVYRLYCSKEFAPSLEEDEEAPKQEEEEQEDSNGRTDKQTRDSF